MMKRSTVFSISMALGLCLLAPARADDRAAGPFAIPTFHSLGLYWSPPGGEREKAVTIQYRRQGDAEWSEGLPMRYNPIAGTDDDLTDYRGSLVHLAPNTTYEIKLALEGTKTAAKLTASTWSEDFPIGETIRVTNRDEPLVITESGTPDGYRVYDGRGATIDVDHRHNACVTIKASYVILRGFTLKGAGVDAPKVKGVIGAVTIEDGHDIIIEDCDISDWGRFNPETGFGKNLDAAIYSRGANVERLVVQRSKLHHPTYDGSNWYEPKYPTHSAGPQCVTLVNTAGNHVIRYNEFYSDMDHMFNDIVGGGSNASYRGSPSHDSDIYGNFLSHCWDDGLEIEGSNRNVRVWDNYITQSMMMIGNAPTTIGPLYIWRNVVERSQWKPDYHGGNFLKMGFATGEQWMTGHQYIFHNTIFGDPEWLPTGGLGGSRIVKRTVSRNNILRVRDPKNFSASENKSNEGNDFDYDLYNGRVPKDQEAHGVVGEPVHEPGAGFDRATGAGRFALADDSPGAGAGEPLPNFSPRLDDGQAPDIGAHQRGAPPMRFGVGAGRP